MKCLSRTPAGRVGWGGLVFLSFLLVLTACGDATPAPQAATVPALQAPSPLPTIVSQPSPVISPALTPAPTPTSQAEAACQPADLTVKPEWTTEGEYAVGPKEFLVGKLTFTNGPTHPCKLAQLSQSQLLDKTGRTYPVYNDRVLLVPNNPPGTSTLFASDESRTLEVRVQSKCGLKVEPGPSNFSLSLNFGPATTLSVPGIVLRDEDPLSNSESICPLLQMWVGPFESTLGTAFTATASAGQATSIAQSHATDTSYAATQTALPPTPTPTVIPTVVPGAKPCQAKDLQIEQRPFNGAGGYSWGIWYLTNTGQVECTLKGYPSVEEVDDKGKVFSDFELYQFNLPVSKSLLPEAATPLVGLPPGHTASFLTERYRCDVGYDSSKPERLLELVLPGKQGKLSIGSRAYCPESSGNRLGVSYFEYAPGDWRTKP